jgi:hypothetical protein
MMLSFLKVIIFARYHSVDVTDLCYYFGCYNFWVSFSDVNTFVNFLFHDFFVII